MRFVIVTGLSGAGKSETMKVLEDLGFYCVDNLPPTLISKFAQLCYQSTSSIDKIALGIDIRGRRFFNDLNDSLEELSSSGYEYEILFLDCDDNVLVKRYKMTRRNHPLSSETNILEGIQKERKMLQDLKERSNHIVNTSNMTPKDLKEEINEIYFSGGKKNNLIISLTSFGFKHGIPLDADLVFDVRFMPNPYYVVDLKEKTGEHEEVRNYVMNSPVSIEFYEKLKDMVEFLIPQYILEGKNHLVIAIGCTGGRHRSVTISHLLYYYLKDKGYRVLKKHRDHTLR
ncbi:RNase adapter RapZ [Alkalithermobacter paradoxus]|uniref:GlmZ(SRNA)-inactivating NTPase n=1 Tax=Alkalithermobacter paradoxus TaxID=29349 RepID=A0A1V4I4T0_9FIRM|nr:glmZ(sRNA)-inactivating NTPase [[Clostridium] thermoalcaliphilum]